MNFNTTISSKKRVSFIDVKISLPCLPIMILAISQKAEDRRGAKSWVQKEEGAGLIRKLKVPRKNCFLFRIRSFHCPTIFFLVQCLQPTKYYLTLLLRHWYEIMALYYVKSIWTEISASRQDRRVLQKSKIVRIKFLSIWGMLPTSGYV